MVPVICELNFILPFGCQYLVPRGGLPVVCIKQQNTQYYTRGRDGGCRAGATGGLRCETHGEPEAHGVGRRLHDGTGMIVLYWYIRTEVGNMVELYNHVIPRYKRRAR